ncbi:phosphatase PAP2 family protein [Nonlabens ulvanivorans]|uniref:phosphatase PAP2 family protein n=1 Tax=Nonlabens ulvanivorans TaxID=906888 RepID=UPI0029438481|nr:phosphatase PAP2 family protein [Nonlabens ulvanivorans]WOI22762.1 phosphatase PAP2 family protein [Nonlabens ulvanivorans]
MWEWLVELDQQIFRYINGSYFNRFDAFWLFVTSLETWLPLYITFFILLIVKLPKRLNYIASLTVIVATLTAIGLTDLVKNAVARLRPNNEPILLDSINILQRPENFSFWSGHTAVSMTVSLLMYLILSKYKKSKMWLLFFIWPLLFATSRIFVGVHYPLDVLVGALVGLFLGAVFYKLLMTLFNRLQHTT